jgi:NADH:ubiquinone oxidoreductase subunit D
MSDIRTETMTVNMGPQHPSTHGVLRLVLELDGEIIQSVIPTIGYLHTGIEKTAEQKKWQQVIPLVERMDYLGARATAWPTRSASRSCSGSRCRSASRTSASSSRSCSASPAT